MHRKCFCGGVQPLITEAKDSTFWDTEVIETITQTGEYEYLLDYNSEIKLEFIPEESGEYEIESYCGGKYHSIMLNEKNDEYSSSGSGTSGLDYLTDNYALTGGTNYLLVIDSFVEEYNDEYNWTEGETETVYLTISKVVEPERETITQTGKYEYQLGYDSTVYLKFVPEETGEYLIESYCGEKFHTVDLYGVTEDDWVGFSYGTFGSDDYDVTLTAEHIYYINIGSLIEDFDSYTTEEYNWTEGETETVSFVISRIDEEEKTLSELENYSINIPKHTQKRLNFDIDESAYYSVELSEGIEISILEGYGYTYEIYHTSQNYSDIYLEEGRYSLALGSFDEDKENITVKITASEKHTTIQGDISGNGSIDLYDAIEIAKSIMGMRTFTDEEKAIADYNGDGVVDLYDAIEIAKTLLPK